MFIVSFLQKITVDALGLEKLLYLVSIFFAIAIGFGSEQASVARRAISLLGKSKNR